MKKIGFLLATVVMLVLFAFSASAKTEGYYTYEVKNGKATITDVSSSISGDVVIPSTFGGYSVTTIGDRAFKNCDSLTHVTIPDSVTSIGSSAFEDCSSLESVTIPDSVTSIGSYAFYECSLTSITVDTDNEYYSSDSRGVLYDKNKKELIRYPEGNKATAYIIPDSVISIGHYAFYECNSLESVTIGNSVTSIGSCAFSSCSSLESVYAVDVESWLGISFDDYAATPMCYAENLYFGNELVKDVIIPDSVTSIGDYAFLGCSSLESVTIPDSVTYIGEDAFRGCSSLESVTIPDSVRSIGDYAFYNCSSLESVTIPDSVRSIGDYAFEYCDSLESVIIGNSVTSIGDYAFEYCSSLTSITVDTDNKYYSSDSSGVLYSKNKKKLIRYPEGNKATAYIIPDSVTSIGSYAFSRCSSLESVTIGNSVTSIGWNAFDCCSSLESVTIGKSVTSIGEDAFYNCSSLESVTIGNSVTSIGRAAFSDCSSLKSVTIGNRVTQIGGDAFDGCKALKDVIIFSKDCYFVDDCGFNYTLTIYGFIGSDVEKFADKYGLTFVDVETVHTHEFKTEKNNKYCSYKKCYCGKFKALKHSYSADFITDTEPTYTQAGSKSRHCTRAGCNAKTSVTAIPKLVLGVPQNLKASSKDTTITLTWDKVDGAKGYRIYRYNNGWKSVKTTAATSYTVTGLTAGTSYRFAVKAYTKNGSTTIWAPKFSEIKTATAPVPPTTVKQTAGTDKTVTVKWDACKNATGYRVYKYNSSTKKWETVVKATTKLTATVSGLSANRQYYIAVKPYTKTESGYVWGTAFTKILVGTAPATPTLKITSTSKGKATIAWNNVAGEKGYQVYYSTSATSGFKKLSNYNADVVKAYKTGLTSGQTYYFKVRSYRVYNGVYVYSPYSSVKSVTIK